MPTAKEIGPDTGFSPEQTAQALRNLRCAVDHCHDVVLITDVHGRIEFVNHSFQALSGFSAHGAVGQNISFFAASSNSGNGKSSAERFDNLAVVHQNMELRRKQGGALVIDCRIAAVRDREAEIANFVYTGRDITTERTLEPELANARNLQSVATLAGGAAHDFNNLLMVISAYAELALRTLYNEHPLP
jgi:two-component system cell cycle sensor histidine kinase/response regulator CckA